MVGFGIIWYYYFSVFFTVVSFVKYLQQPIKMSQTKVGNIITPLLQAT
jgi:hypothetical protein